MNIEERVKAPTEEEMKEQGNEVVIGILGYGICVVAWYLICNVLYVFLF